MNPKRSFHKDAEYDAVLRTLESFEKLHLHGPERVQVPLFRPDDGNLAAAASASHMLNEQNRLTARFQLPDQASGGRVVVVLQNQACDPEVIAFPRGLERGGVLKRQAGMGLPFQ